MSIAIGVFISIELLIGEIYQIQTIYSAVPCKL